MSDETSKKGLQGLWDLKFPQYLGTYFAVGFGLLQFLELLTKRYDLNGNLVDKYLLVWLAILPAIIILIYFKGKLSPSTASGVLKWPKFAVLGNALIALLLGGFMFNGEAKEVEQSEIVQLTDEEGKEIKAVVPALNKIKNIACFQFENLTGDKTLDWWSLAFSELLQTDLLQRPEYYAFSEFELSFYYDQLGLESFVLPNIGMQRKIARNSRHEYFTRISFDLEGGLFKLKGHLYRSSDGKSIIAFDVSNKSPFEAIDAIQQLIYSNIPDALKVADNQVNLPSSSLITNNKKALEYYTKATLAFIKKPSELEPVIELGKKAVEEDGSCANCHLSLAGALYGSGKSEEALVNVKNAIKFSVSLPERTQFGAKEALYTITGDLDAMTRLQELRRKMFPYEFGPYQYLLPSYMSDFGIDSAKELLKEAIANGNLEKGLLELYNLQLESEEFQDAEKTLDRFTSEFPDRDQDKTKYATLYQKQGEIDKSREILLELETLDPFDSDVQVDLAYLDFKSLKIKEANERMNKAMLQATTLTDSIRIIWAKSYFSRVTGEIEKSIAQVAEYETFALKRTPKISVISVILPNKAIMYQSVGKAEKVADLLAELKKYSPESVERYRCISYMYSFERGYNSKMNPGEFTGCKEIYQDYGDGYGEYFDVVLLNLKGEFEKSLQKLEGSKGRVKRLFTRKSFLAKIYADAGRMDEAKELIKWEIDHKTSDPEYYYIMALYLENENKKEAKEYLNIALKYWANADPDFIPLKKAKKLAERLAVYDAG